MITERAARPFPHHYRYHYRCGGPLALGAALALLLPAGAAGAGASGGPAPAIEGVTFAGPAGTLYAPARELGEALGWSVRWNPEGPSLYLEEREVPDGQVRPLADGTRVVALRSLAEWGATVRWDAGQETATVTVGDREARVRRGEKRVAVNLKQQRLRAWQGRRVVLDTRISSGRPGMETPRGRFRAGPLKRKLLISRKYNNARMPWSVQVRGNVVIHGYPSVPPRAASHGCVRVPLAGLNPARWFYYWVTTGTPIRIANGWPAGE